MADRTIKRKELRELLRKYGITEDKSKGNVSHTTFLQETADGTISYPVPTSSKDVLFAYVRGCRRKFGLRAEDGVSDKVFYGM